MKGGIMKKVLSLVAVGFFGLVLAQAAEKQAGKPQTACPVSGKPINKEVYVDYQGQRVYFCCNACPDKFRKDPEKYFAQFEKEGIELENIQKACPVSGEELGEHGEPSVIHYKGRTVKFCCPACEKPFKAEPDKYLNSMPGEQAKQSSSKKR